MGAYVATPCICMDYVTMPYMQVMPWDEQAFCLNVEGSCLANSGNTNKWDEETFCLNTDGNMDGLAVGPQKWEHIGFSRFSNTLLNSGI